MKKKFSAFSSGIVTGFILQMAIGPVFIFIVNLTLQRGMTNGLIAVTAAGIVDFIYISFAILGAGKLLENKKIKKGLLLASSIILVIFGLIIIKNSIYHSDINMSSKIISGYFSSFTSVFILTLSSPLTIVFWTTIFTARAVEKNYLKIELIFFGLGAGIMTFIFLFIVVIILSMIKNMIFLSYINILNITVGSILILYGIVRFYKVLQR